MRGALVMEPKKRTHTPKDKYGVAGIRKLIATIVSAILMMIAGYTMESNVVGSVIMGIAGVTTAFMGGNLLEHRFNRNRYNDYGGFDEFNQGTNYD